MTEGGIAAKTEEIKARINDYEQSIHAIIGFANFYLYDDATGLERPDVKAFQGWPLTYAKKGEEGQTIPSEGRVTPDLGILLPDRQGVIAEVKKSFPRDKKHWSDDFEQLMSYDNDLHGWPFADGRVESHDIVLITHLTRAVPVEDFYQAGRESKTISFSRPFAIVEFSETSEAKTFIFFRRKVGCLSNMELDTRLRQGVSVPMEVFVEKCSTVKFYDTPPPIPYMIEQVWTHVVVPVARESARFAKLKRRQKLDVQISVDAAVGKLREGFSFRSFCDCGKEYGVPETRWVRDACEALVDLEEAQWLDPDRSTLKVFFQRYVDVRDHFISEYVSHVEKGRQPTLFEV